MPKPNDAAGGRRKSLGFFPRPSLSALTPIDSLATEELGPSKKKRPTSFLRFTSRSSSPAPEDRDLGPSTSVKPKTLMKSGRPSSIFGSLRSLHSSTEDDESLQSPVATEGSVEEEKGDGPYASNRVVLHHGEVQTTGGMFRKRKEYLVLTDKHLLRFKSQSKASEIFPAIPASLGRNNTIRHASMSSIGSLQDLHPLTSHSSHEPQRGIALHHIIAVYKVEDGRPYFSIEVAHLDESINHASSMILQLSDPREADLWLTSIRGSATKARLLDSTSFPQRCVEYVARKLEQARDYDPAHFRIFKVVQRPTNKIAGRSSSDDVAKLASTICYMAIGVHMIHLVPLPKRSQRTSTASLSDLTSKTTFGFLALTVINVKSSDDAFELRFRLPLQQTQSLTLASSASAEIAIWTRQAIEYLRPQYIDQPFIFQAPRGLDPDHKRITADKEDDEAFDRTLTAYCAAYDLNTSNIRYTIIDDVDDDPQFTLLPPALMGRLNYSVLELLAVLRAVRYNHTFRSISFRGVNLEVLHQLCDLYGSEHISYTSRAGDSLGFTVVGPQSLLIQELRAIALKSVKLRRMDFSFCIKRKPHDDESGVRDPGCEVVEALFPLCRRQYTNVDWITLNGIELGESDLDYLVDAAVNRLCHLRALEIGQCGLTDRSLQLILNAMLSQDSTLESVDISGNLARLSPSIFQGHIGHFKHIRKLNLSRVHRTSGPEPLVAPETLMTWRLRELDLSETSVNAQTTDSLSAYLASPISETLRELRLNQCSLRGKDLACFMKCMSRGQGQARKLHLYVSENRIEEGHDQLVEAVAEGYGPSHLTMKMAVYEKEYHFRELVQALRRNTTLEYLDISKTSLPGDANEETCEALKLMFSDNKTLEELDISGEHAHLEVAKFGIGLNDALTGLKNNTTLRVLRIEYQKLGLQGANTLSSVLEENKGLREIYCEHNELNLQCLTVLVDGLAKNKVVLYLPPMDGDRETSLRMVEREIHVVHADNTSPTKYSSVRNRFGTGKNGRLLATAPAATFTDQDVQAALEMVQEKWDKQLVRLQRYLNRNLRILDGLPVPPEEGENERPDTAMSLRGIMEKATLGTTPTIEKGDGLAEAMSEKV